MLDALEVLMDLLFDFTLFPPGDLDLVLKYSRQFYYGFRPPLPEGVELIRSD